MDFKDNYKLTLRLLKFPFRRGTIDISPPKNEGKAHYTEQTYF